jgi:hypothetical protein
MKNDQEGERPKDPRHIYANVVQPAICPILSLAIHFLCNGVVEAGKIFNGTAQYDRYSKMLRRLFEHEGVAAFLRNVGLDPKELGTHSIRKGATTYCTSGSTQSPSVIAIYLRAGWKVEGVQNRYLRYEAAGDQYVGRTVCGLPVDDAQFAALPPLFENHSDVDRGAVCICFPHAPAKSRWRITILPSISGLPS